MKKSPVPATAAKLLHKIHDAHMALPVIMLLRKHDGKLDRQAVLPIHFVHMMGEAAGIRR